MGQIYQGKYPTPFERHIAKYDRDNPCWLANRAKEFMRMNEQFWLAGVSYGWALAQREAKKAARAKQKGKVCQKKQKRNGSYGAVNTKVGGFTTAAIPRR